MGEARLGEARPGEARLGEARPGEARPGEDPIEEISLEALEQRHIRNLLARYHNITHVARILDINRRTLQRKLRAWGIESDDPDDGAD